ncbi:MAG: nuclear transport factor 2 family protein [Actinomycetota bacterium]
MHPNAELLEREYEARARGDLGALEETFHEDVVWHVPGHSSIAGTYRGREEVMAYSRRRQQLADGTFKITVHDILANDDWALVIATGRVDRHGRSYEWRAHGLYRFRDGRIAECRVLPEDQYTFDEIWS